MKIDKELIKDINDTLRSRVLGKFNTRQLRESVTFEIGVLLNYYYYYDYDVEWKIVCDETNNSGRSINNNEFNLCLYVKSYRYHFNVQRLNINCYVFDNFGRFIHHQTIPKKIEEYREENIEWF